MPESSTPIAESARYRRGYKFSASLIAAAISLVASAAIVGLVALVLLLLKVDAGVPWWVAWVLLGAVLFTWVRPRILGQMFMSQSADNRPLSLLDVPLPDRARNMLQQLPPTLRSAGYSEAEIDAIMHHPNTDGLASLAGALSALPPGSETERTGTIRAAVDMLLLNPPEQRSDAPRSHAV